MGKTFSVVEIVIGLGLTVFIYLSLLSSGFFNTQVGRSIGLWQSLLPGILLLIAGTAGLGGHKFRKIQVVITGVFILGFILAPLDGYLFGFTFFLTVPLFFLIVGYINSSILSKDNRPVSFIEVWFLTFLISPLTLAWLNLGILDMYSYLLPGRYNPPHFIGLPSYGLLVLVIYIFPVYAASPILLTPIGIYLQKRTHKP